MFNKGTKIGWNGIAGEVIGTIIEPLSDGDYLVRLENGKNTIVNLRNITKWKEQSSESTRAHSEE